mmetsp:Transcript_53296/g.171970  ORF Transcript_53296/g.171970 Transcript_53296/m.171970 type:complete len:201 (+) Transcript_53296:1087-1689(+)
MHSNKSGIRACSKVLQGVEAFGGREKGAVLQGHLTILEEVVECRQHVALCLLETVEDQNSALPRGPHGRLVRPQQGAPDDLAALLQIGLRRVSRERQILHLAPQKLAPRHRQPSSSRPRWPDQERILVQSILPEQPLPDFQRLPVSQPRPQVALRHKCRLGGRSQLVLDAAYGHNSLVSIADTAAAGSCDQTADVARDEV